MGSAILSDEQTTSQMDKRCAVFCSTKVCAANWENHLVYVWLMSEMRSEWPIQLIPKSSVPCEFVWWLLCRLWWEMNSLQRFLLHFTFFVIWFFRNGEWTRMWSEQTIPLSSHHNDHHASATWAPLPLFTNFSGHSMRTWSELEHSEHNIFLPFRPIKFPLVLLPFPRRNLKNICLAFLPLPLPFHFRP